MRVAIVGASGNAGTALLRALHADPAVDSLLGIARRRPDTGAEPYTGVEWVELDVGAVTVGAGEEAALRTAIADAVRGADAVVHLAWLIQPNHRRDVMRRANVDGTARVAHACVQAGVRHLVVASSVGAYAPVDDDIPRDERWPTTGVATSHYSVDKAAQEQVLDGVDGELTVARVRPALIFAEAAGAEIVRYFLGPFLPPALLRPGHAPVLPLPAGLRLQVVHADDVADLYRRVVVTGAGGAFNVATEPVLRVPDLADIVDHGRAVELPPALLRPVLNLAWRARLVAADPGWLDMGMGAPLMDTSRARSLGWEPRHDARETLVEILRGMADGAGTASAPMRPRRRWPADASPPGGAPAVSEAAGSAPVRRPRVPPSIDRGPLGGYLTDHLAGATAGRARIRRMADAYRGTALGPVLREIAADITAEREYIADLLERLQLSPNRYRQVLAWAGERVSRTALPGRVLGRSSTSAMLEVELMRSAVIGKLGVWQVLTDLADDLGLPPEHLRALADQARRHAGMLDQVHEAVRRDAFRRDGTAG